DGNDDARLAVHAVALLIIERAQLDARDVFQTHHRAVIVSAHDDLSEFFRRFETALRADRVSLLHSGRRGRGADATGRIHVALLLDRVHEIGNAEAQFREHVRLHPDAHRVVARTKDSDFADAGHAIEHIV